MGKAPNELINLLNYSDSERTMQLSEFRIKTAYGKRAFVYAGPRLWNLLPLNLRQESKTIKFKKLLKTFLFCNSVRFHENLS